MPSHYKDPSVGKFPVPSLQLCFGPQPQRGFSSGTSARVAVAGWDHTLLGVRLGSSQKTGAGGNCSGQHC